MRIIEEIISRGKLEERVEEVDFNLLRKKRITDPRFRELTDKKLKDLPKKCRFSFDERDWKNFQNHSLYDLAMYYSSLPGKFKIFLSEKDGEILGWATARRSGAVLYGLKFGSFYPDDRKKNIELLSQLSNFLKEKINNYSQVNWVADVNNTFTKHYLVLAKEYGGDIYWDEEEPSIVRFSISSVPFTPLDTSHLISQEDLQKLNTIEDLKNYIKSKGVKPMKYMEKNWKYTIPKDIAEEYAKAFNASDIEGIKEAMKKVVGFIKDKFGDDFYEDDFLEDLDWADIETEDDINYYIGEMYDILDGYNVWLEPPSFYESKMKEATWTVEIYNPRTGETIEKKPGFGSDYAACEYGDHTLEDLEEQGIEADYDTFQESKLTESVNKKLYAKKFGEMLKAVGFESNGADEEVSYDDTGFDFESQVAHLHVSFDPDTKEWTVFWTDFEGDDEEILADQHGYGFNNLMDYLFSLETAAFMNADVKASDFYIEGEHIADPCKTIKAALEEWKDPESAPSNPRIVDFVKKAAVACKLEDRDMLKKLVYDYADIADATPIHDELIEYLKRG